MLLLERLGGGEWEGLARPSRRLRAGERYGPVELLEHLGEGRWRLRLDGEPAGAAPLPPYITSRSRPGALPDRLCRGGGLGRRAYRRPALHRELLARLDVGAGHAARRPRHVPPAGREVEEHPLHGERYSVAPEAWARIQAAPSRSSRSARRRCAPGDAGPGAPLAGRTELFITPGFEFRRVDALLTNFHLPRSTLLALVMAFAGIEETRRLYALAVEQRYRFYSFGDAMLIL